MRQPLPIYDGSFDTIKGVFADIDDTISSNGILTGIAYNAMEKAQASGLLVIPVTGRPAGWCDHIARMWPVDGVIGENGAFYFHYEKKRKLFTKRMFHSDLEIKQNQKLLKKITKKILKEVPGSALASDQQYRLCDLAIDFCEDVERLSELSIKMITKLMQDDGLTVKASSIHINGWLGNYDKLTMTKILMEEQFGVNLHKQKSDFVFIGDSPNDEPMFKFFPKSIGVANIKHFKNSIKHWPKYITKKEFGSGFAEAIDLIISSD